MTIPAPGPPLTVGVAPATPYEVNQLVGQHLRQFTDIKEMIGHDHDFLLATDLKVEPYLFSPDQETLIKSAIADLDTALDGVDMTFINRLTGLF